MKHPTNPNPQIDKSENIALMFTHHANTQTQSKPRRYRQIHGINCLRENPSIVDVAACVPLSAENKADCLTLTQMLGVGQIVAFCQSADFEVDI